MTRRSCPVTQAVSMRWLPVHDMAIDGDIGMLTQLLDEDPTLAMVNDGHGRIPLVWAAMYQRHTDVVRFLLDRGSPIDHQDGDGFSALHEACTLGHARTVALLISRGADVLLATATGRTPKALAMNKGHVRCVEMIQEWERAYALCRARLLHDTVTEITRSNTTTTTQTRKHTGHERVRSPPVFLKSRVQDRQKLPRVELAVLREGDGDGSGLEGGCSGYSFNEGCYSDVNNCYSQKDSDQPRANAAANEQRAAHVSRPWHHKVTSQRSIKPPVSDTGMLKGRVSGKVAAVAHHVVYELQHDVFRELMDYMAIGVV